MGIPFLTLNTVLIPFPPPSPPNQLPFPPSTFPSPPFSTGPRIQLTEPCGAVCNLLRCCCSCAIASIVIFAPAESISPPPPLAAAAAGQREEPLPLPSSRPPPPQLLCLRIRDRIFQFSGLFFIRFSAPCSINHFLVLPGSASSASVVSCQSPQSGCPGSTNPRLRPRKFSTLF